MKKIGKYFKQKSKLTLKNPKYKKQVKFFVNFMLQEDLDQRGDITSNKLLKDDNIVKAKIFAKQAGIIAGLEETLWLLKKYNLKVKASRQDGDKIKSGQNILTLQGKIKNILKLERTILNILQRLSGIATQTNKLVKKPGPLVCPTRKTQWGLLDKKAVILGGGGTHRLGLYDWILIKDNHLKQITDFQPPKTFWEVECKTAKQAWQFAQLQPDAIMLDNFTTSQLKNLVKKIRKSYPKIILEASGGITAKNISQYQNINLDVISLGALTHSSQALDISLDIL